MNESTIRTRLRAAIGESVYPASLTSQIAARLGRPAERRRSGMLLVLVAAVLALAIVAGLIFTGHALRLKTSVIPGVPFAPAAGCVGAAQLPPRFGPPDVSRMATPLTGWAAGGLRTTDGGKTWHNVTPKDMWAAVSTQARADGLYPAGYADYFLDANHGWVMWPVSSSSACADHVAVGSTSDGGNTWKESRIQLALPDGQQASAFNPFFVDARTGWAQVLVGSHLVQFEGQGLTNAYLYATTDGGATWKRVSDLMQAGKCIAAGPMLFRSATVGWMTSSCNNDVELLATMDAGATWKVTKIASPADFTCPCYAQLPQFVDAKHGFLDAMDSTVGPGNYHEYATTDGGATWHPLPKLPATGFEFPADFADRSNFWMFETQPGANKGMPDEDWLYHSADMGQTWQVVSTTTPMLFWIGYFVFFDAQHGFVEQGNVGPPPNAPTKIEVTSDGGLTWQEISPVIE